MKAFKCTVIILLLVITGCASSRDIEKSASNHSKAGDYYKSIGQPDAAKEEYNEAKNDRDHADGIFPLLVDLFDLFSGKD